LISNLLNNFETEREARSFGFGISKKKKKNLFEQSRAMQSSNVDNFFQSDKDLEQRAQREKV